MVEARKRKAHFFFNFFTFGTVFKQCGLNFQTLLGNVKIGPGIVQGVEVDATLDATLGNVASFKG